VAEYLNSGLIVRCRISPMGKSLLTTYYWSGKALNLRPRLCSLLRPLTRLSTRTSSSRSYSEYQKSERVVATVTSDLAKEMTPHTTILSIITKLPCLLALVGLVRIGKAPHERDRSGEARYPFIESDPTMAPVMTIETSTAGIAKGC
jgi:hypothetical protein